MPFGGVVYGAINAIPDIVGDYIILLGPRRIAAPSHICKDAISAYCFVGFN